MLKLQNISKTFNKNTVNENQVFENFSLSVNDGDFITVIGSNGSGKSTLFNIISKTYQVDNGALIIDQENVTQFKEYKVAKKIARVYQNPNLNVALEMSVLENISLALNKGKKYNLKKCISKSKIKKIKEDLGKIKLNLENSLFTKAKYLSGGQRQGLCLYMVTLSNPSVLLLDEHTAALDPKSSELILNLTKDIVELNKLTTVMITHNLHHAIEYGNRIIMLHQGKVVIDIKNEEKKQLTIEKLLQLFENVKGEVSDELIFN